MAKWDLDKGFGPHHGAQGDMVEDVVSTAVANASLMSEIKTLHSKNSRQRNEIARLNQSLERVTKDKMSLLSDIKFLRGEKQ